MNLQSDMMYLQYDVLPTVLGSWVHYRIVSSETVLIVLLCTYCIHFDWNQLCLLVSSAELIPSANSLDPDQARQNVGTDLDPNCLTLW